VKPQLDPASIQKTSLLFILSDEPTRYRVVILTSSSPTLMVKRSIRYSTPCCGLMKSVPPR